MNFTIYNVGFTSLNIHKVETECTVIHALFLLVCLNYVAWTEFSCGVRFAIYFLLCYVLFFPFCRIYVVWDLLYFLFLCWGVMKIWIVWFSDCSSTSHALFFFSSKTRWGWWIIRWIWAFFFLMAGLRSFDRGNWFGPPKSNLPFWAPNQHSLFEPSFSFPMWYNKLLSNCRIGLVDRHIYNTDS